MQGQEWVPGGHLLGPGCGGTSPRGGEQLTRPDPQRPLTCHCVSAEPGARSPTQLSGGRSKPE